MPRYLPNPQIPFQIRPYRQMACFNLALSANPSAIAQVRARFQSVGDMLTGLATPDRDQVVVNRPDAMLEERMLELDEEFDKQSRMEFIVSAFGFRIAYQPANGNGLRPTPPTYKIWGLFRQERDEQMLPEHMWFTAHGHIYDTMPGADVYKRMTQNGLNPACERNVLPANECFAVPVEALTLHQMQIVNAGPNHWF